MKKNFKIKIPLLGLNASGGLRVITQLANKLAEDGFCINIVVPDYASKEHFILNKNIKISIINNSNYFIDKRVVYFFKLCIISSKECDLCIATSFLTPYYIFISKLLLNNKAKLLYLVQHYEPISHASLNKKNIFLKFLSIFLAKFSYNLPFKKIAVSSWIKGQINKAEILVIGNGVDKEVFFQEHHKANDYFTIGFIGSPAPFKGLNVFLDALKLIPDKIRVNLRVTIASQYSLSVPSGIELIKPKNDTEMRSFYNHCDCFVFSSVVEGFGLPPLEAMACGTPVISTDCGGVKDYLDDTNSIIVPVNNPNVLAKSIIEILKNPIILADLSAAGLITSKKYTLDNMLNCYRNFINSEYLDNSC